VAPKVRGQDSTKADTSSSWERELVDEYSLHNGRVLTENGYTFDGV
jgi:hypothetical protein